MSEERRVVYLNPRDLTSRQNVRSDPGDLAGLAETIREHGLLQPLGVTPEGDGYRVVYGNRRRDAAIVVGLNRVPCLILDALEDEDIVVQQVLQHLQRLDLDDLDKSLAFERMLGRLTDEGHSRGDALTAMARTLGLSARQMQRYLRLRQLPVNIQRLLAQGELGVTQAQHLVDVAPAERQEEVAALAVEEGLSASELSRLCAALRHNTNIDPRLALRMLRNDERIPTVETKPKEIAIRLGASPVGSEAGRDQQEDDESETGQPAPGQGFSPSAIDEQPQDRTYAQPTTRDGNRVRKIHSIDAFMDELQRMTQYVQDGDLQRMLGASQGEAMKVTLAARQLRFLADAVAAISRASTEAV